MDTNWDREERGQTHATGWQNMDARTHTVTHTHARTESITYQVPVEKSSRDATSLRPRNGTLPPSDTWWWWWGRRGGGDNAKMREDAQTYAAGGEQDECVCVCVCAQNKRSIFIDFLITLDRKKKGWKVRK